MAIDLHTHTSASDGSFTPVQLVRTAESIGLEALGITDHDTFAGWDEAVLLPRAASLELVCGIELSTKFRFDGARKGTSVHVLAYFLHGTPPASFREWLAEAQRFRRDRNARLAARLQSLGLNVTLDDAESLGGALTGRPHFAKVLIQKGHAKTMQEAFTRYLGEKGKAYVEREEPSIEGALGRITGAGGVPSLAHPVRVEEHAPDGFERLLAAWKTASARLKHGTATTRRRISRSTVRWPDASALASLEVRIFTVTPNRAFRSEAGAGGSIFRGACSMTSRVEARRSG